MTAKRFLIVRLGALGDVLHTLPAMLALRRDHPAARIDWVVEQAGSQLLHHVTEISNLIVVDTRRWRREWPARRTASEILSTLRTLRQPHYDAAIDFQGLLKSSVLAYASQARRRLGFHSDHLREVASQWFYNEAIEPHSEHVIEKNLEVVRPLLEGPLSVRFPKRFWSEEESEHILQWLQLNRLERFVLINPAAGWETKAWPAIYYGQLAGLLHREGLPFVFTGGPGDEPLLEAIRSSMAAGVWKGMVTSLGELAALTARASVFVGGDTGPTHLAAALGKPVVAVYGPTMEARNGPYCIHKRVFRIDLPCSNCYLKKCPYELIHGAPRCMQTTPKEMVEAIQEMWSLSIAPVAEG